MYLLSAYCLYWNVSINYSDRQTINIIFEFYVYGSVHRWSILVIAQRDSAQSSLYINPQAHSTCFGCQPQPSSGVHKTITTASSTGHIFCTATSLQRGQASSLFIIPQVQSTCFGCLPHPSSGCSYSFVYSWWWLWLIPETYRVNLQNNK
jgi:hypothetical protein